MELKELNNWLFEASYNSAPKLLLQFLDFNTLTMSGPFEPTGVDLLRFGNRFVRDYYFKIINNEICCIAQLKNEHKLQFEGANYEYY